jgi:hypothetical protein
LALLSQRRNEIRKKVVIAGCIIGAIVLCFIWFTVFYPSTLGSGCYGSGNGNGELKKAWDLRKDLDKDMIPGWLDSRILC